MLSLTRLDIITAGLSLAGRPDLISDARLWLNLFLEDFYQSQDVDWLIKTSTLVVSDGLSFPADYRAAKSAVLAASTGKIPIPVISDPGHYDALRSGFEVSGRPLHIYADHDVRKFYFIPTPDTSLSLELKYYYFPPIGTHADSSDDGDIPKWGLPFSILVDYIKGRAMEYDDDTRQDKAMTDVKGKVMESKMNSHDRRGGKSKIPMGKSFRKRF